MEKEGQVCFSISRWWLEVSDNDGELDVTFHDDNENDDDEDNDDDDDDDDDGNNDGRSVE